MRHFLAPTIRSYIGCEAACKFARRQVNGSPTLFTHRTTGAEKYCLIRNVASVRPVTIVETLTKLQGVFHHADHIIVPPAH